MAEAEEAGHGTPGDFDLVNPVRGTCQFRRKRKRFLIRILEIGDLITRGVQAGPKLPPRQILPGDLPLVNHVAGTRKWVGQRQFSAFSGRPCESVMIRIDQRSPISSTTSTSRSGTTGGSSFRLPARESAGAAQGAAVSHAGSLDGLLAVQAEEDGQERKRRQARRGHDLLDGLDRLKAALLSGRVSPAELERLKAMLSARREATDDPRLDEVLAHIELRAAVELAKLGR
ncbi:flagellar assembly protein FliX [Bosea sp. (in: a-proteobacteria)]|nr:flagellar assembly protein FliX [Bosea sp. (in: a-proteobacteria)]